MELNWTVEVIINLVAIGLVFVAVMWYLFAIYRGNRYRYYTYMVITEALYLVRFAFITLGILFTEVWMAEVGWAILAIQLVFLIVAGDALYRDSVSTVRLVLFSVLAAVAVVLIFVLPDIITVRSLPSGTQTIVINPVIYAIVLPPLLIAIMLYFILLGKLINRAPKKLKNLARWGLVGYSFMTFAPTILTVTGISISLPGSPLIVSGVGVLLLNMIFVRNPKLVFVLSFRVLRVTVLDTESGLPLFTHTWRSGQSLVNEDLFSSMLQGVSLIIKESLNRGNVREVTLDEGIVIIQRVEHTDVACILVASKASQTLRDGLRVFATKLYEQFGAALGRPNNTDQFMSIKPLIDECFPFVPEYD